MRDPIPALVVQALGLLLATTHVVAPVRAEPLAVIASVRGRVEVTPARSREATSGTFGRPLERGDKVSVGAGGLATLLFNDGNVVELAERSALTIGARRATPRGSPLPADVYAQVSRFSTAGSRQTGLVAMAGMRGEANDHAPLLLAPRHTSILDATPTLSWRSVEGASRYHVRLAVGGAESWSRDVPAAGGQGDVAFAYPSDAPPLASGIDAQWEVEALDERGVLRRESTRVHVLSAGTRDSVRATLALITGAGRGESPAARFLAGSYLSRLGLHEDAASQFRALSVLTPEAAEPHEALGNLYLGVGLVDLAAAEFQQALALQRGAR